jgi:hypothetical protein
MFRVGTQGLTCAAYEVAIESGTEHREGTIRPVRDCTKAASEVVQNTGLCSDCASIFRQSLIQGCVRRVDKTGR